MSQRRSWRRQFLLRNSRHDDKVELHVSVSGLAAATTYDVTVDGVVVGQIRTNATGAGRLELETGSLLATGIVTAVWGGLVATGSIGTIWPMFGIANQLLAALALALVTSLLVNTGRGRHAWFTMKRRTGHAVRHTRQDDANRPRPRLRSTLRRRGRPRKTADLFGQDAIDDVD